MRFDSSAHHEGNTMQRRHLIIPSAMLALAGVLAVRSMTDVIPLGLSSAAKPSVAAATASPNADAAVLEQTAAMDAAEAQLDAALAKPVPALPSLPARVPVAASTRSVADVGSAGGSGAAPTPVVARSAEHHVEDEGGDDDGPVEHESQAGSSQHGAYDD